MFKDVRNIIKHSSIYSFGNVISKAIGIILIPIYTKVIAVELFGVYSILEIIQQFTVGFLHLGLPNALFRWLSLEKHEKKSDSILFSVFITLVMVSFLQFILTLLVNEKLSNLFFKTEIYGKIIIVISMIISFRLLNNVGLFYLRYKQKSIMFIIISISKFFLQLVVTIYFVAFMKIGILGIFWGQLAGDMLAFFILLFVLYRNFTIYFEYKIIKNMIAFGFPLTFSGISSRILNMGDRFILLLLTNKAIVGMYALGYKFANLLKTIVIKAFQTAFIPSAWKKFEEGNAQRFCSLMLTYYIFISFWISLFISIYAKGIIHLFARDTSYWPAYKIIPIAIFSISIRGMFTVFKMGLQFKKQTKYHALIVVIGALLNVILNFLLIPGLGMVGAALATLLSFIFIAIAGYKISDKYYPVNYQWKRIVLISITTFIIYIISLPLNRLELVWRITFKFVLLGSYPLLLYFFKFYNKDELARIKGAWKKWTNLKKMKRNVKNIKLE